MHFTTFLENSHQSLSIQWESQNHKISLEMNVKLGKKFFFVRLGKQTETKLWLLETKAAAAFGEIGFTPLSNI